MKKADIHKSTSGNYGLDTEVNVENHIRRNRRKCEERSIIARINLKTEYVEIVGLCTILIDVEYS